MNESRGGGASGGISRYSPYCVSTAFRELVTVRDADERVVPDPVEREAIAEPETAPVRRELTTERCVLPDADDDARPVFHVRDAGPRRPGHLDELAIVVCAGAGARGAPG